MPLDFKPTPRQAGYAIGLSIGNMPVLQLSSAEDDQVFAAAEVSRDRLFKELTLLMAAAALHAIETTDLPPDLETEVAKGLYEWLRIQPNGVGAFLLAHAESATEAYAKAAQADRTVDRPIGEFSELELALIERLMALGAQNEARAHACVRLGIITPKTLWPAQYSGAVQMLRDAGLLAAR